MFRRILNSVVNANLGIRSLRNFTSKVDGKAGSTSSDEYYSAQRVAMIDAVKPYEQAIFRPSLSVPEVRQKYEETATQEPSKEVVSICGRVSARRDSGQKLFFLDLVQHGQKVQVLAREDAYAADGFATMFATLRRGDIVGVEGRVLRNRRGELSVVPQRIQLLSPCLHPLQGTSSAVRAAGQSAVYDVLT